MIAPVFAIDQGKYVSVEQCDGYRTTTSPYDIPEKFSAAIEGKWLTFNLGYITGQKTRWTATFDGTMMVLWIEAKSRRLRRLEAHMDGESLDVAISRVLGFLKSKPTQFANPDVMFAIVSDHLEMAMAHPAATI